MKRTFLILLTIFTFIGSVRVFAYDTSYTNGIQKGIYYYNQGLYYEAIDEIQWHCDTNWYTMSAKQRETALYYLNNSTAKLADYLYASGLNYYNSGLYYEANPLFASALDYYAQINYGSQWRNANDYLYNCNEKIKELEKYSTYYLESWDIKFQSLSDMAPYYDGSYIKISHPYDGTIEISSYKIGTIGDGGVLTSDLKACGDCFSSTFDPATVELLSENATSVGNYKAYQKTYLITNYTNRYKTKFEYSLQRDIIFEYGGYIFLIDASQNRAVWSNDFYNLMEKVRTSISFD